MTTLLADIPPKRKAPAPKPKPTWKSIVEQYSKPDAKRATWQLVNTLVPYIGLWTLMYFAVSISWWLTIPLAMLAGAMVVRTFIIFHDCGHSAFFKSSKANDFWGYVTGVITFSPYHHWKWEHSVHHATSGHLERRGIGDIWTLTVDEYLSATPLTRLKYRMHRNPFTLFVLGPIYIFLIQHRFALKQAKDKARKSVLYTNIGILVMAVGMSLVFGLSTWILLQLMVTATAGAMGVWLFYVQHQFEDTYWEHSNEWNHFDAAMKGSSFYKLPKVAQWFTGNIGFHHIHHLSSRIPNYNLERCHYSDPMFQEVEPLTFVKSLKTLTYRLWDEKAQKLISFGQLKRQMAGKAAGSSL